MHGAESADLHMCTEQGPTVPRVGGELPMAGFRDGSVDLKIWWPLLPRCEPKELS